MSASIPNAVFFEETLLNLFFYLHLVKVKALFIAIGDYDFGKGKGEDRDKKGRNDNGEAYPVKADSAGFHRGYLVLGSQITKAHEGRGQYRHWYN